MVFPRNDGQRRALIPVTQFNTPYYIAFHMVTAQFLTSDSSTKVLHSSKCSLQSASWTHDSPGWYSTFFFFFGMGWPFLFLQSHVIQNMFSSFFNKKKKKRTLWIIIFWITKPCLFPHADLNNTQISNKPKKNSPKGGKMKGWQMWHVCHIAQFFGEQCSIQLQQKSRLTWNRPPWMWENNSLNF